MSNFNDLEFSSAESEDYPVPSQVNSRVRQLIADKSMDRAKVVVKRKSNKRNGQHSESSGDEEETERPQQQQRKKAVGKKRVKEQEEQEARDEVEGGKVQSRGRGRPVKSGIYEPARGTVERQGSKKARQQEEKVDVGELVKSFRLFARVFAQENTTAGTKK